MLHKDGDSSAKGKGVVLRVRLPWIWNYGKPLLCDRHNDRCHLHFILLDFHNNSPTKKVVFLKMKTWYSDRWSDQPRGHISCQKSREAAVTLCFIPQGSWAVKKPGLEGTGDCRVCGEGSVEKGLLHPVSLLKDYNQEEIIFLCMLWSLNLFYKRSTLLHVVFRFQIHHWLDKLYELIWKTNHHLWFYFFRKCILT